MRTMYERTLLAFELHVEATHGTMVYPPLQAEEAAEATTATATAATAGGQPAAASTDMQTDEQTDERDAKRSRVEEPAASTLP